MSASVLCLPGSRIAFINPDTGKAQKGATFPSALFGWPPAEGRHAWLGRFRDAFEPIGKVVLL